MAEDTPPVEVLRIARVPLRAQARTIGLVPLAPARELPCFAAQLAHALAVLSGDSVAMFDGWPRWQAKTAIEPELRAHDGTVSFLTLPAERDAIAAAERMAAAAAWAAERFGRVLCDLTDLPLGHAPTLAPFQVVMPVLASGGASERALLAVRRALPRARTLGVVLIG
jgi:hypothetical protein